MSAVVRAVRGATKVESGTESEKRKALVIGLGMIGGSIASALQDRNWIVTGHDSKSDVVGEAIKRNIVENGDLNQRFDIAFVATPIPNLVDCVKLALSCSEFVTDVGSVKTGVTEAITNPRFIGGHPMAGSERSGLDGVNSALFDGATWVLTPTSTTSPETFDLVGKVITEIGAHVTALEPHEHDEIVASVSHVPHLAASALMTVALERATEHASLMRLAAGGFRDMTRIAAGHPELWAGITLENRTAVAAELGRVIESLQQVRELVVTEDRNRLEKMLRIAADARRELPTRAGRPAEVSVLHVVIADRPGSIALVVGTLNDYSVNVEDFEITHDPSAPRGSLQITVATLSAEEASNALRTKGFQVTVEVL